MALFIRRLLLDTSETPSTVRSYVYGFLRLVASVCVGEGERASRFWLKVDRF